MHWGIEVSKNTAVFVNRDTVRKERIHVSHKVITDMVKDVIPEGDICTVIPFGERAMRVSCINCGDGWCIYTYGIDPNSKRLLVESGGRPTTHSFGTALVSYEEIKIAANQINALKALQIGGQDA